MSFLKLPAELRNWIYDRVIPQRQQFDVWHYLEQDHDGNYYIKLREPTIASTCRQIRKETLAVYYGRNTFTLSIGTHISEVGEWDVLASFFDSVGKESCQELLDIQLTLTADYEPKARDFFPLVRMFCRGKEAVLFVSSLFVYYEFEQYRGRGRRRRLVWFEEYDWTVEFARDLCEVGKKLRARRVVRPSDEEIKVAIWEFLPAWKMERYEMKSRRIWDGMDYDDLDVEVMEAGKRKR